MRQSGDFKRNDKPLEVSHGKKKKTTTIFLRSFLFLLENEFSDYIKKYG